MSLLLSHLEQISSSARAIGDLSFPPPKIFTNALLGHHEITTLIRDTEAHERALFSVESHATVPAPRWSNRRTTFFPQEGTRGAPSLNTVPRKQSAVARVLGPHLLHEIEGYGGKGGDLQSGGFGGVNIDVLLKGAEKLCAVYSVAQAPEKITALRNRYKQLAESVALYEAKMASQTSQLNRLNMNLDHDGDHTLGNEQTNVLSAYQPAAAPITDDELLAEEQVIRELEQKKRLLEERVASMEKDLGGLLR